MKRVIINEDNLSSDESPITSNRDISEQEKVSNKIEDKINVDSKNRFQINADKITYDDSDGNVYAKGHVEIIAKSQGVVLKADEAVLDKTAQNLKLYDNVKIIKALLYNIYLYNNTVYIVLDFEGFVKPSQK